MVGQVELDDRSVNVRNHDDVGMKARGERFPLDEVAQKLVVLKKDNISYDTGIEKCCGSRQLLGDTISHGFETAGRAIINSIGCLTAFVPQVGSVDPE